MPDSMQPKPVPENYRRLEGSECRPTPGARRLGAEDPGKILSARIRIKRTAGPSGREQVIAFVRAHGLRLENKVDPDEIIVSGTVAQINTAFAVELVSMRGPRASIEAVKASCIFPRRSLSLSVR
jgi:hypothetical protein